MRKTQISVRELANLVERELWARPGYGSVDRVHIQRDESGAGWTAHAVARDGAIVARRDCESILTRLLERFSIGDDQRFGRVLPFPPRATRELRSRLEIEEMILQELRSSSYCTNAVFIELRPQANGAWTVHGIGPSGQQIILPTAEAILEGLLNRYRIE